MKQTTVVSGEYVAMEDGTAPVYAPQATVVQPVYGQQAYVQQSVYGQRTYAQPSQVVLVEGNYGYLQAPPNHCCAAWLTFFLCSPWSWICSVISLIFSCQVSTAMNRGDVREAEIMSIRTAQWIRLSIIWGGICYFWYYLQFSYCYGTAC